MKKFCTICVALLFIAGGAFAQEVKEEKKGPAFNYSIFGVAFGVTGSQKDYKWDYTQTRIRPFFTLSQDDVKLVTRLEIDQMWGAKWGSNNKVNDDNNNADNGNDNRTVEVKWGFLQMDNVLIPGLTLVGGLKDWKIPLIVDNDNGMWEVSYNFGIGKGIFTYVVHEEGNHVSKNTNKRHTKDDVYSYVFRLPVKVADITITPAVVYTKLDDTGAGADSTTEISAASTTKYRYFGGNLTNYAIHAAGKVSDLDFTVAFDSTSGEVKKDNLATLLTAAQKQDVKTMAFDAGVNYNIGGILKVGAFYSMYSGKKSSDTTTDIKSHTQLMEDVYGSNFGRLFLIECGGTQYLHGGQWSDYNGRFKDGGMNIYGLSAEAKLGKVTLFGQYAYVTTNQKRTNASGESVSVIGHEIDLKASYAVSPKSSVFVEYAYILAGDDMGTSNFGKYDKAENVQQLLFGLIANI